MFFLQVIIFQILLVTLLSLWNFQTETVTAHAQSLLSDSEWLEENKDVLGKQERTLKNIPLRPSDLSFTPKVLPESFLIHLETGGQNFSTVPQIRIPPRSSEFRIVYHLYIVFAEQRDGLLEFCLGRGIEAKVHYPVPLYRQPALNYLGYSEGDFPVADSHAKNIITFPCDQHLNREEMEYVVSTVKEFYAEGTK